MPSYIPFIIYPLVNCHIIMEHHHAINGQINYFYGHFLNSFLYVYQRVSNGLYTTYIPLISHLSFIQWFPMKCSTSSFFSVEGLQIVEPALPQSGWIAQATALQHHLWTSVTVAVTGDIIEDMDKIQGWYHQGGLTCKQIYIYIYKYECVCVYYDDMT